MVDHDMKRRPLDRNARLLEPNTQFRENIVDEALIARVVCQLLHNVAVRMRGDGIVCRRVHIVLLSNDLDRRYSICRVPARRRQLIAVVDGRKGFPEVIASVHAQTVADCSSVSI